MIYVYKREEFFIAAFNIYKPEPQQEDASLDTFHNGKICSEYLHFSKNKRNKYPEINVYYGPYECNKIIKYRPEKLNGFITYLNKLFYNVKLIPFGYFNTVEVVCLGYLVYKFNIKYLKFNMPYEDDPICLKAVSIIKEAVERLYSENNFTTKHNNIENSAAVRRATTISLSSKISLSEYDTYIEMLDL